MCSCDLSAQASLVVARLDRHHDERVHESMVGLQDVAIEAPQHTGCERIERGFPLMQTAALKSCGILRVASGRAAEAADNEQW